MILLTSMINGISEMAEVESCISDIADGSPQGLERLYESTKDAVYGYALSFLKNTHDAEDVTHDCYVNIVRGAAGYTANGKPMAWIFTIARNLCLMKLKAGRRMAENLPEDWQDYLKANERISPEDKIVLEHCLGDLNDDERDILLLHVLSGLKHREIAAMTERPLATVLSKYHRTLRKLRIMLQEDGMQ